MSTIFNMKGFFKKAIFALLAGVVICGAFFVRETKANDVAVDEVNFPDEIFRNYVTKYADADNDGFLSAEERSSVKKINTDKYVDKYYSEPGTHISSLKGIEYFSELTFLNCRRNWIDTLDISKNKKLERVSCAADNIKTLLLPETATLKYLNCSGNSIEKLDVSKCPNLEVLTCYFSDIKSIKLGKNIKTLDLYHNDLTNLNLKDCRKLEWLRCDHNYLSSLNVKNARKLKRLYCSTNKLTSLKTDNPLLERLICHDSKLKNITIINSKKFKVLNCSGNKLKKMKISNPGSITSLYCSSNKFTSINMKKFKKLKKIDCTDNRIKKLDVRKMPKGATAYVDKSVKLIKIGKWEKEFDWMKKYINYKKVR